MNEDCTLIGCPTPKNPVQDFSNQYSLDAVVVGNFHISTVVNGVLIDVPPGTITVPISGNPTQLTVQSCSGPITLPVPPGSTPSQVQQIAQTLANQAAQALVQCQTIAGPNSAPPAPTFLNQPVTFDSGCTDALPLTITVALPTGVTQSGNSLVCAAGIFVSNISTADANSIATAFLSTLMSTLFAGMQATCGVAGCAITDNTNLTTVTAPFVIPAVATQTNITVADSSAFDFAKSYGLLNNPFDGTWTFLYGATIIDPTTINAFVGGGLENMTPGTTVNSGAKIWDNTATPTQPPALTNARIKNYGALFPSFNTCPACAASGVIWDGTLPIYAGIGATPVFEQGSFFGGTDQNINGSGSDTLILQGNAGGTHDPMWVFYTNCIGNTPTLITAIKFGGILADGVYYVIPTGIAGVFGTDGSCLTNHIKCFEIETY